MRVALVMTSDQAAQLIEQQRQLLAFYTSFAGPFLAQIVPPLMVVLFSLTGWALGKLIKVGN